MSNDEARLSEEEIAALSRTFQAPEDPYSDGAKGDPRARPLDLVGMTAIGRSSAQAPALDLVHEEFARSLETQLERLTREHGSCHAEKPSVVSFAEVYGTLSMPSSIIVVDVVGFATSGLLVIEPKLLYHIIDLIMGGTGGDSGADNILQHRTFTSTERRLITHVVAMVETALGSAWRDITAIGLRVLRAEVDPRHAAILRPGDAVNNFTVRVRWGTVEGSIMFLVPSSSLRPFEDRLSETAIKPQSQIQGGWRGKIEGLLQDVPLEARAILGQTTIKLRDLLSLDVGAVLRLDTDPESDIELSLAGVTRYRGTPTAHQGNVAIHITEIVHKDSPS